jgi:hypothetical protein
MSSVLYFDIKEFEDGLSDYLKNCSAFYVTAMCPVCREHLGFTSGIYVTVRSE